MGKLRIRVHEAAGNGSLSFNSPTVNIGGRQWATTNLDIDIVHGAYAIRNGKFYYSWETAVELCNKIKGWRLPTAEDFKALIDACGGEKEAGSALKSDKGWRFYDPEAGRSFADNGSNTVGFNAKPSGFGDGNTGRRFYSTGNTAYFWSSTEGNDSFAEALKIEVSARVSSVAQINLLPVRLIKD